MKPFFLFCGALNKDFMHYTHKADLHEGAASLTFYVHCSSTGCPKSKFANVWVISSGSKSIISINLTGMS